MVKDWAGANPYYLLCVAKFAIAAKAYQPIDLDESGWATTYAEWMRTEGEWHLVRKADDGVALSLMIHTGEQPYYTSRVFGSTTSPNLVRAYGIGKKQNDSSMVRLWILENGLVCGGDDVDSFGPAAL